MINARLKRAGGGMFGSNDNKDNPQAGQNYPGVSDSSAGHGPPVPVHGPFSNTSPGGPTTPAVPPAPINDINPPQPPPSPSSEPSGDLLDIKHQALENLAPLVSHLDQSAEEKFKTTMMLIQASDNSQLISQAYEAANQITDEKVRAQALLDVVNEINYFTHQKDSQS